MRGYQCDDCSLNVARSYHGDCPMCGTELTEVGQPADLAYLLAEQ